MLRDSHVEEDTITVVIWCAVWDIYTFKYNAVVTKTVCSSLYCVFLHVCEKHLIYVKTYCIC